MLSSNILDSGNEPTLLCRITTLDSDAPEMTEALLKISTPNLNVMRREANTTKWTEAFSLPLANIAKVTKYRSSLGWRMLKYTFIGVGIGIMTWLNSYRRGHVLPTTLQVALTSFLLTIGVAFYFEVISNKTSFIKYAFITGTGQSYAVYVESEAEAKTDTLLRHAKLKLSA